MASRDISSAGSGEMQVLGLDPGAKPAARELRERTGLVLQDIAVEPYLTVRETIARQAGYYRAPRDAAAVISLTGLAGLERRKVRALSGGQKRRLDLALGLVGGPELLYLDEPTTGFDPAARRGAWDLVRQLRTAGTTILLTTHDMAEAQALADRVVLLSDGGWWPRVRRPAWAGRTQSMPASPSRCRPVWRSPTCRYQARRKKVRWSSRPPSRWRNCTG